MAIGNWTTNRTRTWNYLNHDEVLKIILQISSYLLSYVPERQECFWISPSWASSVSGPVLTGIWRTLSPIDSWLGCWRWPSLTRSGTRFCRCSGTWSWDQARKTFVPELWDSGDERMSDAPLQISTSFYKNDMKIDWSLKYKIFHKLYYGIDNKQLKNDKSCLLDYIKQIWDLLKQSFSFHY